MNKKNKKHWPMPKAKTPDEKKREFYAQKRSYDDAVREELRHLQFSVRR
jgi:hypothetical protein